MIEHIGITTAAGRFDALAAGPADGRPVLLLHGFPEASLQWEQQLGALASAGYRAVAPDQRGYSPGVRPQRPEDYRMADLVGDVLAIADELGWPRFDLVGHDWGGAVAWVTGAEHPARLRTLTVVSTPHPGAFAQALKEDPDQQQRSGYMRLFRQPGTAEKQLLADGAKPLRGVYGGKVPRSHVDEYVQRLSEPGALTAALNWYRGADIGGHTDKVTVPTLYVWGTDDVALGSTAALATEQWVTGPYRFEMLEDVSHWVSDEAGEALNALLLEHLSTHGG